MSPDLVTSSFQADLRLKAIVNQEDKPNFSWSTAVSDLAALHTVRIAAQGESVPLTPAKLAQLVGDAVRDASLSQGVEESALFSAAQQARVRDIVAEVLNSPAFLQIATDSIIDESALYVMLERVLIERKEGAVATALIYQRGRGVSLGVKGLPKVIRRNHKLVDWNEDKIKLAIIKAYYSLNLEPGDVAASVASAVTQRVHGLSQPYIYIEEVQDIVQEELMHHFARTQDVRVSRVVQAYITYRSLRAIERSKREEEVMLSVPNIDQQENLVIIRAKDSVLWNGEDLKERIRFASIGLNLVYDAARIEQELRRSLFNEMTEADLRTTVLLNSKALIEKDPDFAKFAGRILLTYIYEEVLGWDIVEDGVEKLKDAHRTWFLKYIPYAVNIGRLSPAMGNSFNLQELADAIDPMSDLEFDYLGLQTLYDRYLIVDKTGKKPRRLETPQIFWLRVAMGLFLNEPKAQRSTLVKQLYGLYRTRRFCSSTPTLFNSGTCHSQLSSCYLYKVDDSIESIMQRGLAENAYLSKWAGGLGGSWTAVRGTGAHIKGTNGESQGVIPFLKLHNDQLVAINQCFSGNTLIPTQRGFVRIADLTTNDLVLTEDGTYRQIAEVLSYFQNGQPMVEVTLKHSGGATKVTAGHPFMAIQGVPLETCVARTYKRLHKGKLRPDWVDAGNLKKGDYVGLSIPLETVDVPEISVDDARFYGIMLANGHAVEGRNERGITCSMDTEAGQETMQFAREYLKRRGVHTWGNPIHGRTDILRWTHDASLPFTDDELYDHEGNKRIHPRFLNLPKPKTLAIIRGLLRTDGGINRDNEVCFYNTSQQLTEGLRYLLLRNRVPTHTYARPRNFDHKGERADGSIATFTGTLVEYCVRIPLVEAIAQMVGLKPITRFNWLDYDNKLFTRVLDVTPSEADETVYDLKVDGPASYCTTSALVHNGGKRKGSGCAYLEVWHVDILEFQELRKNVGDDRRRTHDMNTANWIPDLFMKRMEARQNWTLFRSNEVPDLHDLYGRAFEEKYAHYEKLAAEGKIFGQTMPAIDLWKKMLSMLFETGHPWVTFKDPCNVRSPQDHVGVIHSSNLCTEITLNTGADETAVCNLGSVILETHLKDGKIDREKLAETIRIAVRALDNVIDINFYPTEPAKRSNERHRPIGLGFMGMGYALSLLNIPFDSPEAVEFNDEVMECIAYEAYLASSLLAKEKGTYSSYKGSKWDRGILPQDSLELLEQERQLPLSTAASIRAGKPMPLPKGGKLDWTPVREHIAKHGMRNSNVIAIAPTATISNIMASSPCIEPLYKQLFVKSNLSGEFIVANPILGDVLKARGLWNESMVDQLKYFDGALKNIEDIPEDIKRVFKTAFEIDFEWLVDAAARRQKWIDQAQSVNLFLPQPDLKALSFMYRAAWHSGMKTTYYLRTLGASSIEKATINAPKARKMSDSPAVPPTPQECESCQ